MTFFFSLTHKCMRYLFFRFKGSAARFQTFQLSPEINWLHINWIRNKNSTYSWWYAQDTVLILRNGSNVWNECKESTRILKKGRENWSWSLFKLATTGICWLRIFLFSLHFQFRRRKIPVVLQFMWFGAYENIAVCVMFCKSFLSSQTVCVTNKCIYTGNCWPDEEYLCCRFSFLCT